MKIKQVSVAPFLNYFKEGLKARWGLSDYYDPYAPCLFFGGVGQVELINKHKGYKLLYFADIVDKYPSELNPENVVAFGNPYSTIPSTIPVKYGWIETRINNAITPSPLGDKVFVYLRQPSDEIRLGLLEVQKLQKKINYEIITLSEPNPIPFQEVVNNYYKKSFISVNFTESAGLTTVCDLGLRGVKTIMNTKLSLSSLLEISSNEEIPLLIEKEAKKIGTIQKPIDNYNLNDVWQDLNFWIS